MAFSVPLLSAKLATAYDGIFPGTLYFPGSHEPGRRLVSTTLLPYCSWGAGRIWPLICITRTYKHHNLGSAHRIVALLSPRFALTTADYFNARVLNRLCESGDTKMARIVCFRAHTLVAFTKAESVHLCTYRAGEQNGGYIGVCCLQCILSLKTRQAMLTSII